ncbi:hypothetical protein AB0M13_09855 [Nocardia fluminea]|uniref:hypothetical protein n=1 Tax=Nocardia fluminea TaxID=134984 RepID=UPI003423D8A6
MGIAKLGSLSVAYPSMARFARKAIPIARWCAGAIAKALVVQAVCAIIPDDAAASSAHALLAAIANLG